MPRTFIETGTPEELVEELTRRAPSLAKGRYRLVIEPELDRRLVVDQLDALFREMDGLPDPETVGMNDDEVQEFAIRLIAEMRAAERTKRLG